MIKWGILGNAWIARDFMIPAIRSSENGCVFAIASRSEPPADIAPEALRYCSYEAMLENPDVDAVYIPVPNALHAQWSIKAMRAGKHVLCEKPLVCTAQEAREIQRVSKETGRLCMEAFMYRLNTKYTLLRKILKEQDVGRIMAMQAVFGYLLDWDSPARQDRSLGGGCLYDIGCYAVDCMNSLMAGQGASFVRAGAVYSMKDGVDWQCAGSLEYSDGTLGSLLCWFNAPGKQALTLSCEKAVITMDSPFEHGGGIIRVQREDGEQLFEAQEGTDPYRLEAEAFARLISGEGRPMITPEESVYNAQVMDALLSYRP